MTIKEYFASYGMDISEKQENQLYQYFEYIVEQNKFMNLTGITEYNEVVIKHFIDSASIYKLNINFKNKSVVDVGTGAGFPGLVLAILYPETNFTLVDSLKKRIDFLNRTIEKIGINNTYCLHSRGEDFAKKVGASFDIGVSRAVARIDKLVGYTLPLIKSKGVFIAYKGDFTEEEKNLGIKALKKYNATIEKIERFNLTENDNKRSLVIIKRK